MNKKKSNKFTFLDYVKYFFNTSQRATDTIILQKKRYIKMSTDELEGLYHTKKIHAETLDNSYSILSKIIKYLSALSLFGFAARIIINFVPSKFISGLTAEQLQFSVLIFALGVFFMVFSGVIFMVWLRKVINKAFDNLDVMNSILKGSHSYEK